MKYNIFLNRHNRKEIELAKCIAVFLLIAILLIFLLVISRRFSTLFFQAGLLFTGWLCWTFTEYMMHRFGHHENEGHELNTAQQLHQYHHTHPNEIKVTIQQRFILFGISTFCLWLSFRLNNYFSLFGGFMCGIAMFFIMHYILHQKWSLKIFPRLHRYHIYHHCKYPGRCHGITVTWWDILFKTSPPEEKKITEKVSAFYYGK